MGAVPDLIPAPARVEPQGGAFTLGPQASIRIAPDVPQVRGVAELLAAALRPGTGYALPVRAGAAGEGDLLLRLTGAAAPWADITRVDESYLLDVAAGRVELAAAASAGLARGTQTLRQLLPAAAETSLAGADRRAVGRKPRPEAPAGRGPWQLPCVRVEDRPRFGWRGLLLDCCRHFMQVDFVKRMIDLLAYHKMNVLHWHLTEDQGWRLQVRKHPRLTEVGAWRGANKPYGGFYTQDEIRDVVAYAAARHVMVVPEIEMPGHAMAALASYPDLSCTGGPFGVETRWGIIDDVFCAGNDRVFSMLEDVLTEVIELFPSPYIHLGADECPKDRWKACPKCQARMKAEKLATEEELQSWFVQRVARFLSSKGKQAVGWDEIMEGEPPRDAVIVQGWRAWVDAVRAAVRKGYRCIATSNEQVYLDYTVARMDMRETYLYEPVPPDLSADEVSRIIGGECCMWTEYCDQSRVDAQVFPRLLAVSENLWTAPGQKDVAAFARRVAAHGARLDRLGVTYGAGWPAGKEPR
jgi:hexosaminidase